MNVVIKKTGEKVTLNKADFLTEGGEGKIFIQGKTAYKIYHDPNRVISANKMDELAAITSPNVIRPQSFLLDARMKPIGYTMPAIPKTYSLCELFPRTFRDREKITAQTIIDLVQKMQNTIGHIHAANILVVDYNEVNFLVDKKFQDVYFIDVDSYQTPTYPATAISPAIKDWANNSFNKETDWFSFGIVSFELFIGIHPFKGNYPPIKYPHDKVEEIKQRLLARVPVFHKGVKFPNVCWPFDVIPSAYKNWYKALFSDGKRMPPPGGLVEVIVVPVITTTVMSNADFDISLLQEYKDNIIRLLSLNGNRVVTTAKHLYINKMEFSQDCQPDMHIGMTPSGKVVSARLENDHVVLFNYSDLSVPSSNILAEQIMSYNGRIFVKNGNTLSEIQFVEMGKNLHAVPHIVANVMEQATKLYEGIIIQNILGDYLLSVFPSIGLHYQIPCPELKGYKIIDAKYQNQVAIIVAAKNGKYDKFVLKMDKTFTSYSVRKVENIQFGGINFIVMDNGIAVSLNEDEQIEIFSHKKDSADIRVIDSNVMKGNMNLYQDGNSVLFSQDNKLYKMAMKSGGSK